MFDGFHREFVRTEGAEIHAVVGGDGPPLLLLHGYPETHLCWARVAPALAEAFTVVVADLRGYGDSSKPEPGPDAAAYAKRVMAADQVELMAALGFDRFSVAGHDRGGRVAHRLALDSPEQVERLAVLDIVPTRTVFEATDQAIATGYFHWFFLIQPRGLPERLIEGDPDFFLRHLLAAWTGREDGGGSFPDDVFPDPIIAEYSRCFADPAAIAATCADYRAAATIDLAHDRADEDARVEAPLLALWGGRSLVGRRFDVLAEWRAKAREVGGHALDCGHFLPEEKPDETAAALLDFFQDAEAAA